MDAKYLALGQHTQQDPTGAYGDELSSWSDEMLWELEAEAFRRLEKYSDQFLKRLGDCLGAEMLCLLIMRDDGRTVIHATQTYQEGSWHYERRDLKDSLTPSSYKWKSRPTFFLKSQFLYPLNLPHHWLGMVTIQWPGLFILTPSRHDIIGKALGAFSKSLTILLMDLSVGHLQNYLNAEIKANHALQRLVFDLSMELYCVSTISNAMTQSRDVEHVLTDVLETILPLVKAKLGVILFPETLDCVMIQSPKLSPKESVDPLFRTYLRNRMQSDSEARGQNLFSMYLTAAHPFFSESMKARLMSKGVENILEFALHHQGTLLGLGFLGFKQNQQEHVRATRLIKITLNMIGFFLEHISLMGDLERVIRLASGRKCDQEVNHAFLMNHFDAPFKSNTKKRPSATERLVNEIERSRNLTLLAELASGIAHQIRNPLNNLVYGLHLLQQDHTTESEKRELFHMLTERLETMNRTINEFIQYTRIPEPRFSVESINEVLLNSLRPFKDWSDLARLEIITFLDPQLPLTKLDVFLINQAFQNIVRNAFEAMSSNGHLWVSTRKMHIRHGPEPRLEFAEIIFQDDGPGIAPDEIEKAMKPFYSKKEGGLGLGLPLVEHIVSLHGGAVALENRCQGGLKVMMYLPIR